MPCTIYVYNDKMSPLSINSIEMFAEDYLTKVVLANAKNQRIAGSLYGATVSFTAGNFSYKIIVDDNTTFQAYAPAYIYPLNGNIQGRLDVILYPIGPPGSGTGQRPSTFQQIADYIDKQNNWTNEQKIGANMLVTATALSRTGWPQTLNAIQRRWEARLESLGISPRLI